MEEQPTSIDDTLSALADPTRRGVIDLLRRGPRPAGELAAAFKMSAPAMSRHLRVLRKRGLVEEERDEQDSRLRIYRLRREPFDDLSSWIGEVESFWTEQIEAFQAHVGRAATKKGRRSR